MSAGWLVGIGASAGGVQALVEIVSSLRRDAHAAYLIVVHVPPYSTSLLPQILSRAGRIRAKHAIDGERIEPGRIYIAPPDHHMRVDGARILLDRGPLENRSRPAIDPLFRSIARCCGERAVGVVLTGNLDDGTSGLAAIKEAGGIAVVQDPADAMHPDMPRNALANVAADHVTPVGGIGPLLDVIVSDGPRRESRPVEPPSGPSQPSSFSCPDCGGVLEIETEPVLRFRCRVGHAYGPESLSAAQSEKVEEALWAALRALEEKTELALRVAERARADGRQHSAKLHDERAAQARQTAAVLRGLLVPESVEPTVD